MLSKKAKYTILVLVTIFVAVVAWVLTKETPENKRQMIVLGSVAGVLVIGLLWIHHSEKDKENFALGNPGSDQIINITQNCGGGSGPSPSPAPGPKPSPAPVSDLKEKILEWMKSVEPALTAECQGCALNNAVRLWDEATLKKTQEMKIGAQKMVLNALIAFNCDKFCVIPAPGLNKEEVDKWIASLKQNVDPKILACVTVEILKMWSPENLADISKKPLQAQIDTLKGLIAFNCSQPKPVLDRKEVEAWLNTIINANRTGYKECDSCVIDHIVNMWSEQEFAKVKAMSLQSQRQIIQAMVSITCLKACVTLPTGLNEVMVAEILEKILRGMNISSGPLCGQCILHGIMENWSPQTFINFVNMPTKNQELILQGIIAFNSCASICGDTPAFQQKIENWVRSVSPKGGIPDKCFQCVMQSLLKKWNEQDLVVVLARSQAEQAKILDLELRYSCHPLCVSVPMQEFGIMDQ